MLAKLQALATAHSCSPAQLSLAWLLHKAQQLGVHCLPIPGTKTLSHAKDNLASATICLAAADIVLLEEIAQMSAGEKRHQQYGLV